VNNDPEIQQAFADYDRQDSITNSKGVSCWRLRSCPWAVHDGYFVYPQHLWPFFQLRLLGAVDGGRVGAADEPVGAEILSVLRKCLYWIPMVFIACLIYQARDPNSYYYAGFNLVLLTVRRRAAVDVSEILATSMLIICAYVAISLGKGWANAILANTFFSSVAPRHRSNGQLLSQRLRFRESPLRFELERNRS